MGDEACACAKQTANNCRGGASTSMRSSPKDHAARAIWAVVGRLDLAAFYGSIEARAGVAGAPAIDPKVLLSLWVYAGERR
jgi:hypothetical protein